MRYFILVLSMQFLFSLSAHALTLVYASGSYAPTKKTWVKVYEKLTEKGRDSYRKMHAWAYDENAVMLLKSLIPRKGELVRPVSSSSLLMKGKIMLLLSHSILYFNCIIYYNSKYMMYGVYIN